MLEVSPASLWGDNVADPLRGEKGVPYSDADPALRGDEGVPYRVSPMGARRSVSDDLGDDAPPRGDGAPPPCPSRSLSCLYSTLLISEIWSGLSNPTRPESRWAPARRRRTSREGDAQDFWPREEKLLDQERWEPRRC